jgi:metallo-beta-lactamase class B
LEGFDKDMRIRQFARLDGLLRHSTLPVSLALLGTFASAYASAEASPACKQCVEWNVSQAPFRIYGNTYYVGVRGLSSILVTSPQGHVLIDGDLPESAPKIVASIRVLGFRIKDVKLILNSHVHYDHAGGIGELQRLSGASVAASKFTARALEVGHSGPNDPQYGALPPIQKVAHVKVIKDGETLHVGPLALTAHLTPGHTPGGTTWTWQSCDQDRCLNMVYADSLTAVAADNFRFSGNTTYPNVMHDFEKSFATLSSLPCDILLTPHPEVSDLWKRIERRDKGNDANALVDSTACRRLAETSRAGLEKRVAQEDAERR